MSESVSPPRRSSPEVSGLFTDLYQLTMAQAYLREGMNRRASFEVFFREMPAARRYAIAAGLGEVLRQLTEWRFGDADIRFLERRGGFSAEFLRALAAVRFTGDVDAVAEGTPVFPQEPLLRVTAPIFEAQLLETLILNQIHFQTLVATKAARVVHAAAGRLAVDFGTRRAHGTDAALKAARSCYLVGMAGTSNVLAGALYGIPLFGTMAHSYIQAHRCEAEAFRAFASANPETTLLVDTYDTLEGVRRVIALRDEMRERFTVRAIRLDSGDLAALARESRRMLDAAGLGSVRIFASGGLNEYKVARLVAAGAPIDGFGIGTSLVISDDAPSLDMAYKLVEFDGQPSFKLSAEKSFYPGRKQVWRVLREGVLSHDLLAGEDEGGEGEPLLQPVMREGRVLDSGLLQMEAVRREAVKRIATIPEALNDLGPRPDEFPVRIGERLCESLKRLSVNAGR